MATTTNYGWTTPDDTALVKDGASAIRTLGTAIDTTTFNNAAAAIAKTIVDAKGDIIAATAADTVSRLAVGANDTVLTADSTAATGLKWATPSSGGMTLISTTSLSGASVTLSSIPATYNNLQLVIRDILPATDSEQLRLRVNGDSATRYVGRDWSQTNAAVAFSNDSWESVALNLDNAVTQNLQIIDIYDYKNTVTWKYALSQSISVDAATTTSVRIDRRNFVYNQTDAISSITIYFNTGNITSGTALLYGVK